MVITIIVVSFLLISAICTAVLISACVVAKRTDEVIDPSTVFTQSERPAEYPPKSATTQQPSHTPTAHPIGKAVSS